MKKFTYTIMIFLLTLVIAPTYAGVNENRVIKLLGQSLFLSPDIISGTENYIFNVISRATVSKPGSKTGVGNAAFKFNMNISADVLAKAAKIEGTADIMVSGGVMSGDMSESFNIALPMQVIYATDSQGKEYLYLYMYSDYSKLLNTYLGINSLSIYDNTWIRISVDEIEKGTYRTSDLDKSKVKGLWNDTSWFTATVRKSGDSKIYTLKIKPTVLMAKMNRELKLNSTISSAEKRKKNADMVNMLKAMNIQITERDGKFISFSMNTVLNETKIKPEYNTRGKKINSTTKTRTTVNLKNTVLSPIPVVIPTQYKDISLEDLFKSIMGESLGNSRVKGEDVAIQAKLSDMRSQTELYYSNTSNYGINSATVVSPDNGCDAPGLSTTVFGVSSSVPGSLSNLLFDVKSSTGYTNVACAVNPSTSGASVSNWAFSAKLISSNDFWCVDSTGNSKKVPYVSGTVDTPEEAISSSAACL